MLTKQFLKQIKAYIKRHFEDPKGKNFFRIRPFAGRLVRAVTVINGHVCVDYYSLEKSKEILKQIEQNKKDFPQYLLNFIAERGFSEVDVCKRAHLDRRVFSNLHNKQNYRPRKRTVLLIAFAMQLDSYDMKELLDKGEYSLSSANKEDVIVEFFFENQIYDLLLLNEVLIHYGFKPFNT